MLSTLAQAILTLGLTSADNDWMNPFLSPFPILRSLALAVICGALAACGGPSGSGNPESGSGGPAGVGASTAPFMPTPDADPFYAQPNPLPDAPPGTILNSRSVQFAPLGIPLPNPAWQLQYMAADRHGRPQAAIATVIMPLTPALTGNRPLVSLQFAVNSPGLKCAPSHQVTGSMENRNSQLEALEYLPQILALGWTLVFPDHLGPTSTAAVGRVAAPIVLNGIRAAISFEPLGMSAETPIGMMGYSGGALATTWSAALQPELAPELNIVGVAAAGLPANLEVTAKAFDGDPVFFPVAFGVVISINRLFPQLLPPGLLNEDGVRLAESVKDGCLGQTTDGSPAPSGQLADYATVPDVYATPGAREVLPQLALPQPGEVPTTEIYFYHQTLDQLAPLAEVEKVVEAWCEAGVRIHLFRDVSGEHLVGAGTAVPSQYAFLLSRFADSPMPVLLPGTQSCN